MRRRTVGRWATAAVLLAAVVAVAAWRSAAGAPPPGTEPDSGSTRGDVLPGPDVVAEVRDYWTPERMNDARPAPMPEDD
ncbi:hypothetical protein [Streptomyces sp. AM8-1-1]|uniref:hypothetical protein n=1 Tax=Streptomyces sp. AM8-1-1 TaxID=3075825 RepID=UPI0028C3DCCC|nr:hypothetical protein [Streptomyces sp. AM8-1-1]WNO76512.1 hypothetical protein RPQ07_34980 [Streptomyces sp. AM8-1-1]